MKRTKKEPETVRDLLVIARCQYLMLAADERLRPHERAFFAEQAGWIKARQDADAKDSVSNP